MLIRAEGISDPGWLVMTFLLSICRFETQSLARTYQLRLVKAISFRKVRLRFIVQEDPRTSAAGLLSPDGVLRLHLYFSFSLLPFTLSCRSPSSFPLSSSLLSPQSTPTAPSHPFSMPHLAHDNTTMIHDTILGIFHPRKAIPGYSQKTKNSSRPNYCNLHPRPQFFYSLSPNACI